MALGIVKYAYGRSSQLVGVIWFMVSLLAISLSWTPKSMPMPVITSKITRVTFNTSFNFEKVCAGSFKFHKEVLKILPVKNPFKKQQKEKT